MNELEDRTPDLTTELRLLRQAIGDLAVIITGKIDLRGPAVLDMKEAASSLGTTRDSLYDLVGRGGIPCRRIGRKFIFPKADLDAWLQQLPGISVPQAIASIPLERRELWVKASVRIRYEESPVPQEYTPLTRGPKGHNRERLKAEPSAQEPIILKRGPRRTHLLPYNRGKEGTDS